MKYRILLDDAPAGASDWLPIAQAAWARVSRERDAAHHGGEAVLMIDGRIVATVQPRLPGGHPWPVPGDHVADMQDVAKAILALARVAGVGPQDLAQAMTDQGLPTTAGRLKAISTLDKTRRSHVDPAELVAICYAAIAELRGRESP